MNLSICGHHVEITPAMREFVTMKLERVKRHFDQVIDARVVLSVDKQGQKAEVILHLSGRDIVAECMDSDLYAAIDGLMDKIDRQVLRHKTRLTDHSHSALKHQVGISP